MTLTRRHLFSAGAGFVFAGTVGAIVTPPLAKADAGQIDPAELAKTGPDGDIVLGSEKAPVTVIEYASMTCPHCAHFSENTFPELQKRYIDTGKVRFIFREFPLDALAAEKFNVNSTPTFFINGKVFRGALTPEELDKQVAPYLKG